MPDVNLAPYDPQQQALNRRRALAMALQQESLAPIESAPNAPISWSQGAAKLMAALMGVIANRKLDKEQKALYANQLQQRMQEASGLANAAVPQPLGGQMPVGTPQPQGFDFPGAAAPPETPPATNRMLDLPVSADQQNQRQALVQAITQGMASPNPELQDIAKSMIANSQITNREQQNRRAELAQALNQQNYETQKQYEQQQFQAGQNALSRQNAMNIADRDQWTIHGGEPGTHAYKVNKLTGEVVDLGITTPKAEKPVAKEVETKGGGRQMANYVDGKYYDPATNADITAKVTGEYHAPQFIPIQTVDANGNPITKIVSKAPGEYGTSDQAKEAAKKAADNKAAADELDKSFNAIVNLAKQNTYSADQAILTQYFDVIKPGSGARMNQNEIDRLAQAGTLPERAKVWWQKLSGRQPFTPEIRNEIINAAKAVVDAKKADLKPSAGIEQLEFGPDGKLRAKTTP